MNERAAKLWKNYRWVICGLLFFISTVNYMDRQVLALIKNSVLDKEFHFTNADFGYINSAFQFVYAFGYLAFGWFIDKVGTKLGYAVSVVFWGVFSIMHVFASGIITFIVFRAGLGLGEGGNFPAGIKAVAEWFPKKERAYATSIFNAGTNFGPIITPILIPLFIYYFGWKAAFIVLGVLAFAWIVVWAYMFFLPEKTSRITKEEFDYIKSDKDEVLAESLEEKIPWLDLLKHKETWAVIVARFLGDPVWWFFLIWLPDFFYKERGLEIKQSWPLLTSIYVLITVISIFGGWMVKYLMNKGWSVTGSRKTIMLISALCTTPLIFTTHVPNWAIIIIIGLAGGAHQSWSANLYTIASDIYPKNAIASVVGLGGFAAGMGGALFPIIVGIILDHFEALGNAKFGYSIVFAWCSCAYVIAFILNHLLAPKFVKLKIAKKIQV